MTDLLTDLSRADVRSFVATHADQLELAQAEGRLPHYRLDLRDKFELSVAPPDGPSQAKALKLFDEEVEAFCQQQRIGGVVVTNQVERSPPQPKSNAGQWLAAWLGAFVVALLAFAIASGNNMDGKPALGLILVSALIAFLLIKPSAQPHS